MSPSVGHFKNCLTSVAIFTYCNSENIITPQSRWENEISKDLENLSEIILLKVATLEHEPRQFDSKAHN